MLLLDKVFFKVKMDLSIDLGLFFALGLCLGLGKSDKITSAFRDLATLAIVFYGGDAKIEEREREREREREGEREVANFATNGFRGFVLKTHYSLFCVCPASLLLLSFSP